MHLDTVKIKVHKKDHLLTMNDKYASGLFSDPTAKSFDLLNDSFLITYFDLERYLEQKVPAMKFQFDETTKDKSVSWNGYSVAFYLNQIETPFYQIANIPLRYIAYIKAYDPPFIGSKGFDPKGAIGIFLKKGGDISVNDVKNDSWSTAVINTYSSIKQFYTPNYDDEENQGKTDVRTTLYWNPFIYTDESNKDFHIKFKNNDITKAFRLVLEGINAEGKLIHEEQLIYK